MLKRLRVKFICINMGIVVAMLAIIFILVLSFTRKNLEQETVLVLRSALGYNEPRGRRGLGGFWYENWDGDWDDDWDEMPVALPELPGLLPYILVEVNWLGEISHVEGYDGDTAALDTLVEAAAAAESESGVLHTYNLRYLREETPLGCKYAFADMSSEQSTMSHLMQTVLLIGAASLIAFFFLSLLLARWAVRPVETAWRQQKQFVSDASHELKTPLTVIMTNAELLQDPEFDAAARGRFSENILTMARQMRGLVESLLELARVDNGAAAGSMTEIDFSQLCVDAALPFEPLYFERGLDLTLHVEPDLQVRGSASHLREVLEIFLDNAQKYAAPDSHVRLSLAKNGRNCALRVENQGAPIAPEDMAHLFERFYRADKSRSRDGSYGLGLSIAQKIVETHRGKIWAESSGGVNSFCVTLPAV